MIVCFKMMCGLNSSCLVSLCLASCCEDSSDISDSVTGGWVCWTGERLIRFGSWTLMWNLAGNFQNKQFQTEVILQLVISTWTCTDYLTRPKQRKKRLFKMIQLIIFAYYWY